LALAIVVSCSASCLSSWLPPTPFVLSCLCFHIEAMGSATGVLAFAHMAAAGNGSLPGARR